MRTPPSDRAVRTRFGPRSASWILAAGLASGVLTYAFMIIPSRALTPSEYSQFAAFWSVTLILSFGFFLPIEQESARLISVTPGDPAGVPPHTRAALRVSAELTGIAFLALAACAPFLLPAMGDSALMIVLLAAYTCACAVQFTTRGMLMGKGRLRAYGIVMTADTALRVIGAAVAAYLCHTGAMGYAVALCIAVFSAHVVPLLRLPWPTANRDATRRLRRAVAPLLVASLCAAILLNAGPAIIGGLGSSADASSAGAFLNTFSIARIPLFLGIPLQTSIIPPLARAADGGQLSSVRRVLALTNAGIACLGVVGAIVAWFIGPWVVTVVYGPGYTMPPLDNALLVIGVFAHLGLILMTQAIVALRAPRSAALAWLVALATAAVLLTIIGGSRGVEWGFLVGSALGWVIAGATVMSKIRLRAVADRRTSTAQ